MTVRELIQAMESAYGPLPARHKQLLTSGEHEKHPLVDFSGWLNGQYKLDFTDDLMPDVHEFGDNLGILDMGDVPWPKGLAPLAALWPSEEDADDDDDDDDDEPDYDDLVAKAFLVLDLKTTAVLAFDHDGWRLYPLAPSLDAFLAGLPRAVCDTAGARHISEYGKK